jgi:hypothetical protein
MTTYDLTDEQKKRVTEVLGDCFNDHLILQTTSYCRKCKHHHGNHTFSAPQDAHDLAKKLVEMWEWELFGESAWQIWARERSEIPFTAWLFAEPESPQRFSWLVNAYLEEKE